MGVGHWYLAFEGHTLLLGLLSVSLYLVSRMQAASPLGPFCHFVCLVTISSELKHSTTYHPLPTTHPEGGGRLDRFKKL